jgi:ribose transport system substrate-binding protein
MVRMARFALILCLVGIAGGAAAQQSGWTDFSDAMLNGSTIEAGARYGGPLPSNCPVPPIADHYTIGFAQSSSLDDWHQAMNDQMNRAVDALNAAGGPTFELTIQDATQNTLDQISQIDGFLAQKVDLLIISPVQSDKLTDEVNKAWNACIPVILLDSGVTNTSYSTWIHPDNVTIGRLAGQYVAQYCATRTPCSVLEIAGVPGSGASNGRHIGFNAGLERSQARVVSNVEGDWVQEMAQSAAADTFKNNPDIQVVFAQSDRMAAGAYQAAQQAGLNLSRMLFVGIDGLPTADGGITAVLNGQLGATFIYPTGAKQAIDWAKLMLADHINPPQQMIVPSEGVFPQNAQAVCNDYRCPLAQAAEVTVAVTAEATASGG